MRELEDSTLVWVLQRVLVTGHSFLALQFLPAGKWGICTMFLSREGYTYGGEKVKVAFWVV